MMLKQNVIVSVVVIVQKRQTNLLEAIIITLQVMFVALILFLTKQRIKKEDNIALTFLFAIKDVILISTTMFYRVDMVNKVPAALIRIIRNEFEKFG